MAAGPLATQLDAFKSSTLSESLCTIVDVSNVGERGNWRLAIVGDVEVVESETVAGECSDLVACRTRGQPHNVVDPASKRKVQLRSKSRSLSRHCF